ncbi:MAG: endonuclease/exonuclease/phosphatase family protein, partial [Bacteroidaceae bacterium]|nr:endonuclease/exonuclease/phosphatase family protein [Bacteroidaceae bacterium]
IVGMQEVLNDQLTYLQSSLKEYSYIGVGRTDGNTEGEYSCIFYKKDKYEVLDQGNFWLSETPEKVGSIGWDAAIERIASWGKFRDKKTGKIFMAVNTHFDHVGVEARKQSALLIIKKIREIVGTRPAVVTGDFNITDQNEAYKTMVTNKFVLKDAFKISPSHGGVRYTCNGFGRTPVAKREKIDFIFVTPKINVIRTVTPLDVANHIISDHNPHWADLEF